MELLLEPEVATGKEEERQYVVLRWGAEGE